MAPVNSSDSFSVPTTKTPIPPAYTGLVDSATFGRLASRPDRINNEAVAFFNAWLNNNPDLVLRAGNGALSPNPKTFRIGSSNRPGAAPTAAPAPVATAPSAPTSDATAVSAAKK